ncbi:hypothetical protein PFUGPA_00671 [Plasmodium falciparum Palo Alto/Uganda]|uniref:Rifin n=1 Tax=Plasmodium falciparum (isolate Palo Alto / Uganda) TaxID=57270 RepID=W4J6R6_PLAFP|nr:hypothetical protein PFUGPA_00671 [Plasmodium falciparum Palo Alto/Uganda]
MEIFHYVYNQRNYYITPRHTETNRSLCECELYGPANYDNDPQMKSVMDNFNKQTQQRFHEYDERMKTTRQKCREQCDKEIQKIILKDKLEKELMDKFATLQTDIQNDAIPTCVCEKSLEEKVEKGCLKCGVDVGGGVTLSSGILGGIGAVAVNAWKPKALETAIAAALKANATKISVVAEAAGELAGKEAVIGGLKNLIIDRLFPDVFRSFQTTSRYTDLTNISSTIYGKYSTTCTSMKSGFTPSAACNRFQLNLRIHLPGGNTYGTPANIAIPEKLTELVAEGEKAAKAAEAAKNAKLTAEIKEKQTALIEAGFNSSITSINASIIAILIIVIIMVIIYLILRYRRKKKMKKKLQYIKLLKE